MNSPQPMPTPNLADLLARKSDTSSTRGTFVPLAEQPESSSSRIKTNRTDEFPTPEPTDDLNSMVEQGFAVQSADAAAVEQREYLRSIALYLPRTMHQQLAHAATERGTTRTALILNAINSTHERIGSSLAELPLPARRQDLFTVPQSKANNEPSVQTTIRVTDAQYGAITALVAEHHTNRSHLITTALRLFLARK